jgi:hypothetical protein
MRVSIAIAAFALASSAFAGRPDEARFPNLFRSWEAIQAAKGHVQRAEQAHANRGSLGGHGAQVVTAMEAAEAELTEAVSYGEAHRKRGAPGAVTEKAALTATPDDAKYPNLGEARLQIEWAIRHIEDAMQFHAPIGTLGGHGEKAVEHLRRALKELTQAERWADTH